MNPILKRVAGVDVHKEVLAITVLIENDDGSVSRHQFNSTTFTEDLIRTGLKIKDLGVVHVAMESTGVYWKPIYNTWAPLGLVITLGNAAHLKNVPGRKTDLNDSEWIATLHRSGLIRPSFIPEREYQELRLLTRHRQNLVEDASRLKNRVQKILEDANIKLSSVITDVFGVSGLKILRAIAQGITDKDSLAALVCTKIKRPLDVPKAMHNTLTKTQIMIVKDLLRQFDEIQSLIVNADSEIATRLQKHHDLLKRLDEVPGINQTVAQTILAEATADMSHFKDDRAFAAWAGVAPGNNESASKKKEPGPEKETLP